MSIEIHDYSDEKSAKRKRLAYNPRPYPVTATENGQSIGGHCAAYVSTADSVANALFDNSMLESTSEWIVLGIPEPSTGA